MKTKKRKPQNAILISMDGGIIQSITCNIKGVTVMVVDYDGSAWTEDVADPKKYDPDFKEGTSEVYGTACVAKWENIPVVRKKFWKTFEVEEKPTRHSDIQEMYVRDKLKEMNF